MGLVTGGVKQKMVDDGAGGWAQAFAQEMEKFVRRDGGEHDVVLDSRALLFPCCSPVRLRPGAFFFFSWFGGSYPCPRVWGLTRALGGAVDNKDVLLEAAKLSNVQV